MAHSGIYDTVIIGGGPAGASCALWLKQLGLSCIIVEKSDALGGALRDSRYPNEWIAGVQGQDGVATAKSIDTHIRAMGIEYLLNAEVQSVGGKADDFSVTLADGKVLQAKTVLIATGIAVNDGGYKGARILAGQAAVRDADVRGKNIALLGGGDGAFEMHTTLKTRNVANVHIYARNIRAQPSLLSRVPPVDVRLGDVNVDTGAGTVNGLAYDLIGVFYGFRAVLPPSLPVGLDARGFVTTNADGLTSVDGIYAAGEVVQKTHPCAVTAMAEGVAAAKAIQRRLAAGLLESYIAAVRAGD